MDRISLPDEDPGYPLFLDDEVRLVAHAERTLPIVFDPTLLHTEGSSNSPSTFEEREARGDPEAR